MPAFLWQSAPETGMDQVWLKEKQESETALSVARFLVYAK